MACKCLTTKFSEVKEIDGSIGETRMSNPGCKLNREPGFMGWVKKCELTPSDGPCWVWVEVKGENVPDRQFENV